jgi:hypothetical protein
VEALEPQSHHAPVWEDFGCKANDSRFDNGPKMEAVIRAGATPAVGGNYFVKSPIVWPHRSGGMLDGRNIATLKSLIPEGPTIEYWGSDAVIQDVLIDGLNTGTAIEVKNDNLPPTGHLITRNLTIEQFERGLITTQNPKSLWATEFSHHDLHFRGVKYPYRVTHNQSCHHKFYGVEFRTGFETAIQVDAGGPVYVWGCYVGKSDGGVLLDLGLTDSGTGNHEIHGLHTDGNAKNLILLKHRHRTQRVRITGNVSTGGGGGLAAEYVINKDGRETLLDIEVDIRGVYRQWK